MFGVLRPTIFFRKLTNKPERYVVLQVLYGFITGYINFILVTKHPSMMRPVYHEEKFFPPMNCQQPMPDCQWMQMRDGWSMGTAWPPVPHRVGSPLDSKPNIHNSPLPGYSSEFVTLCYLCNSTSHILSFYLKI